MIASNSILYNFSQQTVQMRYCLRRLKTKNRDCGRWFVADTNSALEHRSRVRARPPVATYLSSWEVSNLYMWYMSALEASQLLTSAPARLFAYTCMPFKRWLRCIALAVIYLVREVDSDVDRLDYTWTNVLCRPLQACTASCHLVIWQQQSI